MFVVLSDHKIVNSKQFQNRSLTATNTNRPQLNGNVYLVNLFVIVILVVSNNDTKFLATTRLIILKSHVHEHKSVSNKIHSGALLSHTVHIK